MSKTELNLLTGHDFFKAREAIGLSVRKVNEMTGVARTKLSEFEKEKATLAANEKRDLKRFYEERGYTFGDEEAQEISQEVINTEYEANKTELEESIQTLMPNETAHAFIDYIDSMHSVLTAHGYFEQQAQAKPDVIFDIDVEAHKSLLLDYQKTEHALVEHFTQDAKGEIKLGWNDSKVNRASSLVSILAVNQLRLMAAQGFSVPFIDTETEWGTDGQTLSSVLIQCLERDALDVGSFNVEVTSNA